MMEFEPLNSDCLSELGRHYLLNVDFISFI